MRLVLRIMICFIVLSSVVNADDKPFKFTDNVLQDRYNVLLEEIRCLVCQNQSLADSNADLAQDLRDEIQQQLFAGKDDNEITQFLVERYGDFVLYRPPLQKNTWLLWFGPFLFLFFGVLIAIVIIRKQSKETTTQLSNEEQQRITKLLKSDLERDKQE